MSELLQGVIAGFVVATAAFWVGYYLGRKSNGA